MSGLTLDCFRNSYFLLLLHHYCRYSANDLIWVKVFKNGPSKIYGRQLLKNFICSNLEYHDPFVTVTTNTFIKDPQSFRLYFPTLAAVKTIHGILIDAICVVQYIFDKKSVRWTLYTQFKLKVIAMIKLGISCQPKFLVPLHVYQLKDEWGNKWK